MQLPDALKAAIQREIDRLSASDLRRAAEEMSERYRTSAGGPVALSPLDHAGYLATRLPATYAAVSSVLVEMLRRCGEVSIHSVLDLGAGPGTAAWAATEVLGGVEKVSLIERDSEFARLGKRLAACSSGTALERAEWISANLNADWKVGRHDLVVVSYAIGELDPIAAELFLERAWEKAAKLIALVEPGSKRGFRDVLRARSKLIAMGAHVIAPCPHQRDCPLSGTDDWCHFRARIERPSWHRRLKSGTLPYEDEKFSYVLASRTQVPIASMRVIRRPMKLKGHVELALCGPAGTERRVVARHERPLYRQARKIEWGDEWPPAQSPEAESW